MSTLELRAEQEPQDSTTECGDLAYLILWDAQQDSWPSTPKGRSIPKELKTPRCSLLSGMLVEYH